MNDAEKFAFGAELEKLICEEADARRSYYLCLTKFIHLLTPEEMAQFKEIVSEELKHSAILSQVVERLTKIVAEK